MRKKVVGMVFVLSGNLVLSGCQELLKALPGGVSGGSSSSSGFSSDSSSSSDNPTAIMQYTDATTGKPVRVLRIDVKPANSAGSGGKLVSTDASYYELIFSKPGNYILEAEAENRDYYQMATTTINVIKGTRVNTTLSFYPKNRDSLGTSPSASGSSSDSSSSDSSSSSPSSSSDSSSVSGSTLSLSSAESMIKEYYYKNNHRKMTSIQEAVIAKENENDTNRVFVWVKYTYDSTSGMSNIGQTSGYYEFLYTGSSWEIKRDHYYSSRNDFERSYKTILNQRIDIIPTLGLSTAESMIKEYYYKNNYRKMTSIQEAAIAKENENDTNTVFVWVEYTYDSTSGMSNIGQTSGYYEFLYTGSSWEIKRNHYYSSRNDFERNYRFRV